VTYRRLLGNPLRAPLTLASRRSESSVLVRNLISLARNAIRQTREALAS